MDFFSNLFSGSGFVPRAQCGMWTHGMILLQNLSDFFIWLAYMAIPLVLMKFAHNRGRDLPFRRLYWLFGLFILACGTTHFMDIVMFYNPLYRLLGLVKLITAVASWGTVAALIRVMPYAMQIRTPADFEREIAQRQRTEAQLQLAQAESEAKTREIVTIWESMTDYFFSLDTEWRFTYVNPQAAALMQRNVEELIGNNFWEVFPEVVHSIFYTEYHRAVEEQVAVVFDAFSPGTNKWREVHAYPSPVGLSVYYRDITDRKYAEQQILDRKQALEEANTKLEVLATTDELTGLSNRRAFQERLQHEFDQASRSLAPLSLILLDIDRFKQYNDTFGHPAGDEVLKTVAQSLLKEARTTDLVARYGGEEFAVILVNTDAVGARIASEKFRAAIKAGPWHERSITASLGTTTKDSATGDIATLIATADKALYRSKKNGRNQVTQILLELLPVDQVA